MKKSTAIFPTTFPSPLRSSTVTCVEIERVEGCRPKRGARRVPAVDAGRGVDARRVRRSGRPGLPEGVRIRLERRRGPNAIGSPSGSLAGTANVQTAFCGQITIGGIVDTGELFGPAPARTIVWTL